jgi:hypothetical protein
VPAARQADNPLKQTLISHRSTKTPAAGARFENWSRTSELVNELVPKV